MAGRGGLCAVAPLPALARHPLPRGERAGQLARVPTGWNHPAEKDSRQINMLEHVPIAKPLHTLAGHALNNLVLIKQRRLYQVGFFHPRHMEQCVTAVDDGKIGASDDNAVIFGDHLDA
jgi:hypothetical protein